jgi:hypothetical protein
VAVAQQRVNRITARSGQEARSSRPSVWPITGSMALRRFS